MSIHDFVLEAEEYNRNQLKKYNSEIGVLYEIAVKAGKELSKKYNADENVVKIALALMDSKIPEAQALGTPKQHTKMAVDVTKEMLEKFEIDDSIKQNIIKCILEHHGVDKYYSIESEICANADTYKFLHPKGILAYASILGRRTNNLEKEIEQLEFKMDEKYNAISLSDVRDELEVYYHNYKDMIKKAREY